MGSRRPGPDGGGFFWTEWGGAMRRAQVNTAGHFIGGGGGGRVGFFTNDKIMTENESVSLYVLLQPLTLENGRSDLMLICLVNAYVA